ncbi:hypothetical protein EVAR_43997_1 [Eumeta japonica]|uniref:Uncharacterized protein n=1 Tax=Eumeta variegata TaxID=151549 RepID=A0A4C1XCF2_EUMVA|nr:hypothetical protein EVAR_43997_1 [Eumeta japonica]
MLEYKQHSEEIVSGVGAEFSVNRRGRRAPPQLSALVSAGSWRRMRSERFMQDQPATRACVRRWTARSTYRIRVVFHKLGKYINSSGDGDLCDLIGAGLFAVVNYEQTAPPASAGSRKLGAQSPRPRRPGSAPTSDTFSPFRDARVARGGEKRFRGKNGIEFKCFRNEIPFV